MGAAAMHDFRSFVSDLSLPVAVLSRAGGALQIVEMSHGLEETLAVSHASGRLVREVFPAEPAMALERAADSVRRTGRSVTFHSDLPSAGGDMGIHEFSVGGAPDDELILFVRPKEAREPRAGMRNGLMNRLGPLHAGAIYILDLRRGRIVYATENFAQLLGWPPVDVDKLETRDLLKSLHPDDQRTVRDHVEALATSPDDKVWTAIIRLLHADGKWRWFESRARVLSRDRSGKVRRVIGVAVDITERRELGEALATASQALLQAEEQERRRIARELHDSTAQLLTAAALYMSKVENGLDPVRAEALREARQALRQAQQEIRTFAYLMHPPELSAYGLIQTLENFTKGFSRRTGLAAKFVVVGKPQALGDALELAFFRVAQEALMNVHKHADASRVDVRLRFSSVVVALEIEDDGVGIEIRSDVASEGGVQSVGLSGMRARMTILGGYLEVLSRPKGLLVRAMARLPQYLVGAAR